MSEKKGADIVSVVHNLLIAKEHMNSFMRDRPQAVITRLFRNYSNKIEWMFNDMKSEPLLNQVVRDGINQELKGDVFSVPAINEKISLLPPGKRELIEEAIDRILNGEQIEIEIKA